MTNEVLPLLRFEEIEHRMETFKDWPFRCRAFVKDRTLLCNVACDYDLDIYESGFEGEAYLILLEPWRDKPEGPE